MAVDCAAALMAFLRTDPSAIIDAFGHLSLTRTWLAEAERAHANGNISETKELALSAFVAFFAILLRESSGGGFGRDCTDSQLSPNRYARSLSDISK